ncbi:f-box/lrr-repeat protein 2-like [Gigaspora margarita]|uniref:F-box/lrr-repeat protein 2-like n=1 Tax=Gigaspora margarita TaxID=4874 RepID=A0A8H3XC57_GIGMA|nr:f-box/lrr-repeat protein 2-like [Gigaspora margarita]
MSQPTLHNPSNIIGVPQNLDTSSLSSVSSPYLPTECLQCIFSFISEDDIKTLHSVMLVNRSWCKTAVQFLWKKPFTVNLKLPSLFKIIPIYLNSINVESLSIEFRESFFHLDHLMSCIGDEKKLTFDYPTFLRELNFKTLYNSISEWTNINTIFTPRSLLNVDFELKRLSFVDNCQEIIQGRVFHEYADEWGDQPLVHDSYNHTEFDATSDVDFSPPESHTDYEEVWDEDCDQYYDEYVHFDLSTEPDHSDHEREWLDTPITPFDTTEEGRRLIISREICMMLMTKCRSFDKLILDMRGFSRILSSQSVSYISLSCFPGANECLSRLTEFFCGGEFYKGDIFNAMTMYCKDLYSIVIVDTYRSAIESLANLISVQKRLQKFSWTGGYEDLSPITLSFSSQRENLIEVQLENAFFRDSAALEGLAPCQNLESLKIAECQLTAANLKPLVDVTFPRLQVLEITDVRDIYYLDHHEDSIPPSDELNAIIRRANGSLREIRLNLELHFYPKIIDTIAECCPNLKVLAASIKDDEQIPELLNLLNSCRQLESLIIHGYNGNFFTADSIMPEIGSTIPETLRYLDLTKWTFKAPALNMFLSNCNAELRYFSWHCVVNNNTEEYTTALENYAQEKELEIGDLQVEFRDSGFGWCQCVCNISVELMERLSKIEEL